MKKDDFKNTIKANNLKEHLRVVKDTVQAESDKLNAIKIEIIQKEQELSGAREALSAVRGDYNAVQNHILELNRLLDNREEAVSLSEQALLKSKNESDDRLRAAQKQQETERKEHEQYILSLKNQIEELSAEKETLADGVEMLEDEYDLKAGLVVQMKDEYTLTERSLIELRNAKTAELLALDSEKESLNRELADIQKQIDEEKEKVKLPLENLHKEQIELEAKKHVINTLSARIQRLYKEILNIDIKI